MTSVRIFKQVAASNRGGCEVRYQDGQPSRDFYWDDLPGRTINQSCLVSEAAITAQQTPQVPFYAATALTAT